MFIESNLLILKIQIFEFFIEVCKHPDCISFWLKINSGLMLHFGFSVLFSTNTFFFSKLFLNIQQARNVVMEVLPTSNFTSIQERTLTFAMLMRKQWRKNEWLTNSWTFIYSQLANEVNRDTLEVQKINSKRDHSFHKEKRKKHPYLVYS